MLFISYYYILREDRTVMKICNIRVDIVKMYSFCLKSSLCCIYVILVVIKLYELYIQDIRVVIGKDKPACHNFKIRRASKYEITHL